MQVRKIVVGRLEENCYILEHDNQVLLVDPGDEANKIIQEIGDKKILKILITHGHFDHIGAVCDIIELKKIGMLEYSNLKEQEYEIGPFKFKVLFTKGHSKDSVTYYFEKERIMFVGDFVFKGTIGRCDLDGGNLDDMKKSIEKLKNYPKDTILYPGHGDKTVLEDEIKYNPYF